LTFAVIEMYNKYVMMFLFITESKSVTLSVNIDEIRKVLIHFGRGMPVLFFYIVPPAAARVRVALNMESKLGPYYDPASQGNF
jgi:sentrin-specific protease 7